MIIKDFLQKILDEIKKEYNISNYDIDIIIEENNDRPLAAKIFENQIVWSEHNFEMIHQTIYELLKENDIYIEGSIEYFYFVTKCCLCHEIGHFLDKNSRKSMCRLFAISQESCKCNTVQKYNILALEYKDIKVSMEIEAWNICENIMNMDDLYQKKIFDIIKSYFLQTYFNIV
ncbi:MAG: hypothetical protein IJH34_16645 [Romboutsia sp.]|nr:hypothetical protein [Romboutsia sp.]